MTHPHVNPFENEPAQATPKAYFGTMRVVTNRVNLTKGAAYTETGLMDRSGNPYEFRGKMKDDAGQHTHVIVVIQARNSSGQDYNAFRDFMYWQTDEAQRITMPSLKEHFGEKLEGIWNKSAEVKASVVEFDDRGYAKQALRVDEVYKNRHERENAETAHFAQFNQASVEDDPIPFGDEEETESPEAGMTRQQATDALPGLFAASGKDETAFKKLLSGMPVIIKALGDDFESAVFTAMQPF